MGSGGVALPLDVDLWAPVPFDGLPAELRAASERGDWDAVSQQLHTIMDGVTTDGVYGRALLQFIMSAPLRSDPILERYRAAICIDHGDWDGLRRHLAAHPIGENEVLGVRDIILAPIDQTNPPRTSADHEKMWFEAYESNFQRSVGRYRRWAHRMLRFYTPLIWARGDVPVGRHLRYRRLQDAAALATGEAQGGSLAIAEACADEAEKLGDEGEPRRDVAHDLKVLVSYARGRPFEGELRLRARISSPAGFSPLGALESLLAVIPFYALLEDESLEWAAALTLQIAKRLGSPRAQLQASGWRVASSLLQGRTTDQSGLPGLLAESRRAAPGLRVVPLLLHSISTHKTSDFLVAESTARRAGNVWAQVSALTWWAAIDPNSARVNWLHRLLETTGWRRPLMVPATVAAGAALALTSSGRRGTSIIELASAAGRPDVIVEVSSRHLEDPATDGDVRRTAIEALGMLGTTHSREILQKASRRNDETGAAARRALAQRSPGKGLSDREIEVLDLARSGLTNREIAERLSLSPHTVARHLVNARVKLGAANRTEAAVKLDALSV